MPTTPNGLTVQPLSAQRYLAWDAAKHECPLTITATNTTTGATAWSRTVGQWSVIPIQAGNVPTCAGGWQPASTAGRLLAMTVDERPEVIDIDTGTPVWTGHTGALLLGLIDNTAIVRANHGLGDLSAINLTTNHTEWTRSLPPQFLGRVAVSTDTIAYTTATSVKGITTHLTILDDRTGKARTANGDNQLLGLGPGWALGGTGGQTLTDEGPPNLRLYIA
jgi:hypothetical protein